MSELDGIFKFKEEQKNDKIFFAMEKMFLLDSQHFNKGLIKQCHGDDACQLPHLAPIGRLTLFLRGLTGK